MLPVVALAENEVFEGRQVRQVIREFRGLKAFRGSRDAQDAMAAMALKVCRVCRVYKVSKVNKVNRVKKALEDAQVRLVKKVLEDLLAHEVPRVRLAREVCKGTAEALDLEAPMVAMDIQAKLVGTARMDVMAATVGTGVMGVMVEMRYQDGGEEAKINERLTLGRRARFHRVQQGSNAYSTTVVA
ncbi:hypothetical protein PMIN02_012101 [Paraphaeosphaeria minitans]